MAAEDYLASLKSRLANPAVTDADLLQYLNSAMNDVRPGNYSAGDYTEQILDTACMKLAIDNKFPEISGVSQNGLSTSFTQNDPERFRRRITERRQAALIGGDY